MQARNTMAQGRGFNRMTAAAAGIALLAASALGVAISDQVELPLIGGSSATSVQTSTNRVAEIAFAEQNVFDYQGATGATTLEAIRFAEDNSFDYIAPKTAAPVQFLEENVWEYASRARLAGDAQEPSSPPDYRFIEENTWSDSPALPAGELGQNDY